MSVRRWLVVVALAGGVGAPATAAAACSFEGPYLGTHGQVPLGCPVYVYAGILSRPVDPQLTALRGGQYVDVTGSSTHVDEILPVEILNLNCQGDILSSMMSTQALTRFTLTPAGVSVGERIGVNVGWFGGGLEIVAPGECAPPELPMLACAQTPPCGFPGPFEDFESDSCAASAGGAGPATGLWVLLAALGARGRRRRGRPGTVRA